MIVAAALLIAGGAVAPAGGVEVTTECGLKDLADATGAADFNNDRDRAGLVLKVENASVKFTQRKYSDSEAKIWDYYSKVYALKTRNKMDQADGTDLMEAATGVIDCLQTYQ
jgi:hypothetical protein